MNGVGRRLRAASSLRRAESRSPRNCSKSPPCAERSAQGGDLEQLRGLRDSARRKLLAARSLRPTPFIDKTLYTGWNAMAVTAYLETARVLRMDSAREFALRTLNRLLNEAWDGAATLHHVIAYPDDAGAAATV